MSNDRRKLKIQRIRDEGRAAFLAGRHFQTNPYYDMDRYQWAVGWGQAQAEAAARDVELDPRDAEIAALKAEVERLTRERDEAIKRANDAFTAFEVARRKP